MVRRGSRVEGPSEVSGNREASFKKRHLEWGASTGGVDRGPQASGSLSLTVCLLSVTK